MVRSSRTKKACKKQTSKSSQEKNAKKKRIEETHINEKVVDKRLTIGAFSILYYFIIAFFMLASFASVFSTNPNRILVNLTYYIGFILSYAAIVAVSVYNLRTLAMAREMNKKTGIRGLFIHLSFIPAITLALTAIFL